MKRRMWAIMAVLVTLSVGAAVLLMVGHRDSASGNPMAAPDAYGVRNESVQQVQQLLARGAVVLDVRSDAEFASGRLAGSIHIPLAQVQARAGELPKNRVIVAVCHDGGRSYKAAFALHQMGYNAVNLAGGLKAWVTAGLPVVTASGAPGQIV